MIHERPGRIPARISRVAVLFLLAAVFGLPATRGADTRTGTEDGVWEEFRAEGWTVPKWNEGTRQGRKWLDLSSRIEGEETKAVGYVGKDFPLYVVWSLDNEKFAVIVDEDGRAPFEYGLWDRDGDGKFEYKTGAYRKLEPPEWVVDHYFRRRGLPPPDTGSEAPPAGAEKSPPTGSQGSD